MSKTLIKELPFGKGAARITVTAFEEKKYSDGIDLGFTEVVMTQSVEIVADGKVVVKAHHADAMEYNSFYEESYKRSKLDFRKNYSRVDRAITEGDETAKAINQAFEDMKVELAREFGVKTEKELRVEEEIEEAKAIVKAAEGKKLMTAAEIKKWRKQYNDTYNEGGEGYIPPKISQEQFEWAKETLERHGVR